MTSPFTSGSVLYKVADGVAEVVLNRPGVSNAIDVELAERLREMLVRADQDPLVRVVLLLGAGRVFCAGGDLAAMDAAPDRSDFLARLVQAAHGVARVIDQSSKPVVCGVQGAAAGAGFALALGADLVVAGRSATFVTAYTSVGLTPDTGLSWLLPRAIGQQRASELILTSDPLPAERARELGIVTNVSDDDNVAEIARALANRLAARPPRATAGARLLARTSWSHTLDEHLDREAERISEAAGGHEAAALIEQFVGKTRSRGGHENRGPDVADQCGGTEPR